MSKNSISANNSETAYKPKTAVIGKDEIFDPDEFYYLEVSQYLFHGRVKPGEMLLMRKGCLAAVGNMVQVASSDPLACELAEYQEGIEYSAVCIGRFIPDDLPQAHHEATRQPVGNGKESENKDLIDVNKAAFEAALLEVRRIEAERQNEQSNKPQEPLQ
jgi:hypothetical protein